MKKGMNMLDYIKKLKVSERIFMFLSILAVVVAALPLYRLGMYACPFYDDYNYGNYVRKFFIEEGFVGIFKGMFYTVKLKWYIWQGTYSSIALMSIVPSVFGEKYYFIGVWVIISSLFGAVFFFTYRFVRMFTRTNVTTTIIISNIMVLFLVELINTAHQGFFWYNGAEHYTLMYCFMLVMLACCLDILKADSIKKKLLLQAPFIFLTFVVAGANFVVILQGLLLIFLFCGWGALYKNKNVFYLIPGILVYVTGMTFNVIAPEMPLEVHIIQATHL